MKKKIRMAAETWLVAAGRDRRVGAPLNVPPIPASNFILGDKRAYSRDDGTPGWEALEEIVGGLEAGTAVSFASGMAAVAAVFAQLPAGALVVLPEECYQGVAGLAAEGERKGHWQVRRLRLTDTAAWQQAAGEAQLLWLESPSNPLLEVAEVDRIAAAPRGAGTLLAVDNTFATPLNQRPLTLGADISMQSATKWIGGHSDLLSGIVSVREEGLAQALRHWRELGGATPGALESYLAVRGVRTLAVRFERAQANAAILAERLEKHPAVAVTRYPGLASHATHAAARRQLAGFGTVVSFEVQGGAAAADAVCQRVRLVAHATSLGGVESTMERRAAIPGQEHLPAGLLRLCVGIEAVEDLWADLAEALGSLA